MKPALPAIVLLAMAGAALPGCDRTPAEALERGRAAAGIGEAAPDAPATAMLKPATPEAAGAVRETVTTGKIKSAIASDAGMQGADIAVKTDNGVVTLSGTARSQEQVTIATQLAQRQEGVRRVEAHVTLR